MFSPFTNIAKFALNLETIPFLFYFFFVEDYQTPFSPQAAEAIFH